MLFRQLFDPQSSTYSYLLADSTTREAVLIDPVYEQVRRDAALLAELNLKLVYTLETHVHADHVTGAWMFRHRHGSEIALSGDSGAEGADRLLHHGDRIPFGGRELLVRATPGHTAGCLTYVLDNEGMAFTGDCLLIRGCGRTDFQGGDPNQLYASVHTQIFTLPEDCLLYPGHDYRGLTVTSVGEEKSFNPRLGGQLSQSDFAGYMANLGLDHPKKMDVAVPANLLCGRPQDDHLPEDEPTWAPLTYTFAGIWEVQPQWLEEHLNAAQILDVREADEFDGPLGRIPGAKLIPLGSLAERTSELRPDRPVIAVCRAGGRSAQATTILRRAGFGQVANLAGGMLRWRAQRCVVEGGRD
ncbi:MBL fold metallo-hydrolase [Pelagibius marinus]|uniref:MBL fold metallo-hydrolase n=1 Tax=Pelagibius marinus TaxID=2762760 RepID=UPI0018733A17|nr:MBL fold metallo-hydrolase [Pelagibius marinus]